MGALRKALLDKVNNAKNMSDLSKRLGLSRQSLYKFVNGGDLSLSTYEQMNEELSRVSVDEAYKLFENFESMVGRDTESNLDLNTVLSDSVGATRLDGRLYSVWVSCLLANISKVDFVSLLSGCQEQDRSAMGFLFDSALLVTNNIKLAAAVDLLYSEPKTLEAFYVTEKSSQLAKKRLKLKSDPLAKKWGFLNSDDMGAHKDRWLEYLANIGRLK